MILMSNFNNSLQSGVYATARSLFKALYNDQLLCKLLYYPQENMTDDPTDKGDLTPEQKDKIIIMTRKDEDLSEPNDIKRCKLTFSLGNIYHSTKNQKSSSPTMFILIFVPIVNFQDKDFRLEAIIDRVDQLISDKRFDGSFGRVTKGDGNPYEAPLGYNGYILRYSFYDTDF